MHISDGVLPTALTIGGLLVSGGVLTAVVRKLETEEIPRVAVAAAAFFVASLVHVPLGPTGVHLLLIGMVGIVLGRSAFAAISLALFFQCLLFGFGGLTSLGVNALVMGLPAMLVGWLFSLTVDWEPRSRIAWGAFLGGAGTLLAVALFSLALAGAGEDFIGIAKVSALAHLPVVVIEAVFSGLVISFLVKVKPELLGPAPA